MSLSRDLPLDPMPGALLAPGAMASVQAQVLGWLTAGRAGLQNLAQASPEPWLLELLQRVEGALLGLEAGNWATCSVCHETIGPEGMADHPLVSICLGCMTEEQRTSLERDLESAARVQRLLLPPRRLHRDGWEVQYLWEPFGAVSGDHVDLIRPWGPNQPMHLLVGDVAGKGLAASLLQSQLHALFRALVPDRPTLSELLGRANQLFFETTSSASFATLAATRLYADGRVVVANAGHPRPLRADDRGVWPIEEASIPLGMLPGTTYVEHELQLEPQQTLLLYTDGWTEAYRNGRQYGEERAAAVLGQANPLPLGQLLGACRADLEDFLQGGARQDDVTLAAVRRTER